GGHRPLARGHAAVLGRGAGDAAAAGARGRAGGAAGAGVPVAVGVDRSGDAVPGLRGALAAPAGYLHPRGAGRARRRPADRGGAMIRNFARSISPTLVLGLTVLWLLLNQSVSPGHIVLGVTI